MSGEVSPAAIAQKSTRVRLEDAFFPGMAVLILAAVFLGFAPTFFLAPIYHYHLPNFLVALHGTVFTLWILLFAVQASLVPAGRVDLHKKLGVFGAFLAALVFLMGYAIMLEGLHRGLGFRGQDPAQVLALDVIGVNVSFAMFAAGLLLRGNPAFHKRLMLFGTLGMLGPAIARWPFAIITAKPPLVGIALDLFALMVILFDLLTMRRVHRATWIGTASLFVVPLIAIPLSISPFWRHLLESLKQFMSGM
jgi:hypothetical protein